MTGQSYMSELSRGLQLQLPWALEFLFIPVTVPLFLLQQYSYSEKLPSMSFESFARLQFEVLIVFEFINML